MPLNSKEEFVSQFVSELTKAESGDDSSLSWLSVPLKSIQPPESFDYNIVLGGTNIKVYSCGELTSKFQINGLDSGETLIHRVLDELPTEITSLNVNAAYPMKPAITDRGVSGSIIRNVKDHVMDDILNRDLGDIFCGYNKNIKKIQILNDVSLLVYEHYRNNQSNAGMVLGTGFNFGIIKQGCIINLESGNFDKFDPKPTTLLIDKESNNPGRQILEKEVAGKYLYQHYNLIQNNQISSTEELASIDDEYSQLIWSDVTTMIQYIQSAIEDFLSPSPVVWSYEGSVIDHVRSI
jgi:hypothetical protein